MHLIKHFKVVMKHKWYVFILCSKCGFPLRGLKHDMSKLGFKEFFVSAKYFQGDRSPIEAEKAKKGYSLAWLHHKGRNPHHWEYWIDGNKACKMPFDVAVEMMCDWLAAGIVYSGSDVEFDEPYDEPIKYYRNRDYIFLHEDTQKLIEGWLELIELMGIEWWTIKVRYGNQWY